MPQSLCSVAVYSFRFDRITAEIKLMVYRVANFPNRFPWPDDMLAWQKQVHNACGAILAAAEQALRLNAGRRPDHALHSLTLKYHQCLMILYRPSPAFPEPSASALKTCFHSATEMLRIHAEMNRFANLLDSWLTAHTVFTSGITMLYCLWMSPEIRNITSMKDITKHAAACTVVLERLGKTWNVAEGAKAKFDRLVQLTTESWKRGLLNANNLQAPDTATIPQTNAGTGHRTAAAAQAEDHLSHLLSDESMASFWNEPLGTDIIPGPDLIMDELGDMSTWFDLDWLGDVNYANLSVYP